MFDGAGKFANLLLCPLAFGDVAGEVENVRLAVQLDDGCRHQPVNLACFGQEGRFVILRLAFALQHFHNFLTVFGIFPDIDFMRSLANDFFAAVAGDLLEAFVDGNEHAIPCAGDGNRVWAGIERQPELFLAGTQGCERFCLRAVTADLLLTPDKRQRRPGGNNQREEKDACQPHAVPEGRVRFGGVYF